MSLIASSPEAARPAGPASNAGELISLTLQLQSGEGIPELFRRLAAQLSAHASKPLHLLVFGNVSASAAAKDALRKNLGCEDWPMTWAEGADCNGRPIAGIQVHAFTGDVERIEFNGQIVGSVFTEGGARQCLVGGLTPADKTLSRAEQTRHTLEKLQAVLAQARFDLADTVRTWFFLADILSWYDDFNRARTKIYSRVKFRTGCHPASTGVGAKNSAGTALALAAWAFRPLETQAIAAEIPSPLQCPAPAYASSFSRAVEMSSTAGRRLLVSGTASIAPGGTTLWTGDVRKQIELTMDVVEALLRSRGMTFADLTRTTAYFRHPVDAGIYAEWLAANRLANMPVISAQCDVCRDDLLFELEAEAETEN